MKKLITSTTVILVAGLALAIPASNAGIVNEATPLRVKLATFDGKKKLKVAKKFKFTVSCSKNCSVNLKLKLRLPGGTLRDSTAGQLAAGQISPLSYRLNSVALNQLKSSYRSTRFVVRVAAKDLETGKRTIKTRSFGFYR